MLSGQFCTIPYPQITIHNTSFALLAKDHGTSINIVAKSEQPSPHDPCGNGLLLP